MKLLIGAIVAIAATVLTLASADAQPRNRPSFVAGQPVGVTVGGEYTPLSDNAVIYGGLVSVESCVYDPNRGSIVVPSRGLPQNLLPNDAFVSLLNHDGSVQTLRWIGFTRNGLTLNQPFGSAIANGTLYIADRDGGLAQPDGAIITPTVAVVRMFDTTTGAPTGSITVEDSYGFDDMVVAADGTIYATQSGPLGAYPPPETMRVYKIMPDGTASIIVQGAPLAGPSGIAFDGDGNLVVINNRNDAVMTFSTDGELLDTEDAAATGDAWSVLDQGNTGVEVGPDGSKYIVSFISGLVTRIPPGGGAAEVIASGVPGATSMCLDADANQLVLPLGTTNAVAFVHLGG